MTDPSNVPANKKKLVKKIFQKYKDEVFFKDELADKIKEEFGIEVSEKTIKYHADQVCKEENFDKYLVDQSQGMVWGCKDSIQKIEQRFEI